MKIAKSILNGGTAINAKDCVYGDCDRLKIVCPSCQEPLFLAIPSAGGEPFFSHYAGSKEEDIDRCPLRVSSRQEQAETLKYVSLSREQYKRVFLARFWELLESCPLLTNWEINTLLLQSAFHHACPGHDSLQKERKYHLFIESYANNLAIYSSKIIELIKAIEVLDELNWNGIHDFIISPVEKMLHKEISLAAFEFLLGQSGTEMRVRIVQQAIALKLFPEGKVDFENAFNPELPMLTSILEGKASGQMQQEFNHSVCINTAKILISTPWQKASPL